MNTLNFDEKGCLKPYTIIETDLTTFRETFVFNKHRLTLFENYENFNAELQNLISCPSIQWIGGSFVTLKEMPKDIDTVTFIPFDVYHAKEKQMEKLRKFYKNKEMDCFFEYFYPHSHRKYQDYISNRIYWQRLYSKYPVQNQAVRWLPKGFLEINF